MLLFGFCLLSMPCRNAGFHTVLARSGPRAGVLPASVLWTYHGFRLKRLGATFSKRQVAARDSNVTEQVTRRPPARLSQLDARESD